MSTMPFRLATTRKAERGRPDATQAAERHLISSDPVAGTLLVEAHRAEATAQFRVEWADLVSRCLEPNVFMDPGFCLPLVEHAAPSDRLIILMVWSLTPAGNRTLLAVCPLHRAGLPFGRLAASFAHELCALAAPLLDRERAEAAVRAVLGWLQRFMPDCGAWLIPWVEVGGPTARLIETLAGRTCRPFQTMGQTRRAVLHSSRQEPAGIAAVSPKKAKELRRQRRRLVARGVQDYASATSGDAAQDAVEDFLRLEARGWKGRRGTAMLMRPEQAAFCRAMVGSMVATGRCRIDSLTLNGRPIAMGIVLSSGGRDYFWKTAYDEAFAHASPGVHFVLDLTERQQQGAAKPDLTDSCAVADHPMIDHLWRGRIDFADLLIAVTPGSPGRFWRLIALERLRRKARARVKAAAAILRRSPTS